MTVLGIPMSEAPQLPVWVSYVQALAIPVISVSITAAGALFALAQLIIAPDRFEIDAFDRQYGTEETDPLRRA